MARSIRALTPLRWIRENDTGDPCVSTGGGPRCNRFIHVTMAMVAVAFCGQAWLGMVAPAQAATVTDTFELKVTAKEWCQDNPKFFETITAKVADASPSPSHAMSSIAGDLTDIDAKINNTGEHGHRRDHDERTGLPQKQVP